jgi:hypothetical protein
MGQNLLLPYDLTRGINIHYPLPSIVEYHQGARVLTLITIWFYNNICSTGKDSSRRSKPDEG